MGRKTKEKEMQILNTYSKVKEYAKTAEIEQVDVRTVSRLIKRSQEQEI